VGGRHVQRPNGVEIGMSTSENQTIVVKICVVRQNRPK
jgi:hypothetical protein